MTPDEYDYEWQRQMDEPWCWSDVGPVIGWALLVLVLVVVAWVGLLAVSP